MSRRDRDEIERDIREHLEMETRENIERGMSPGEARAAALRKFGNPLRVAEETRAVWQWGWVEGLAQDVRYAVRGWRRNPGFAAAAILTLALGIGMNSAVFSVVNAVLMRPLGYPLSERLLWLATYQPAFQAEVTNGGEFQDWRAQAQSYDKLACYTTHNQSLLYGDAAEQVTVAAVTADLWAITGAEPMAGHLFTDRDRDAIVLSHALWERRFGGDVQAVGKTVLLEGRAVTVAGILPRGFRFELPTGNAPKPEAYILNEIRSNEIVRVVGRVKAGVSPEQARGELETIQARMASQKPYKLGKARVIPVQEKLVGSARPALLLLLGAVAFVLLIACANIAGLMLARSAARRREVAIRAAVGAGQARVIAQFLGEGLALALAGGLAGLALARGALVVLLTVGGRAVPRLEEAAIDGRVLAFTLLMSLLSGLLFGLGPAISVARSNLYDGLKEGARVATGGFGPRMRTLLAAGELAAALVLLTGAGLMVKSLWRMNARPPGFHPESILEMKFSLSGPAYREPARQIAYFEQALERLRGMPGIESAGMIYSPVRGVVVVEDAPRLAQEHMPGAVFYSTSPGYFGAMGIRLLAGRWMADREPSEVVLVNETFVRKVLGGGPALGRHVLVPRNAPPQSSEIVGVVSDVKYSKLDIEPEAEVYFPYRQSQYNRASDIVARVSGDPLALAPAVRKTMEEIDRTQPVFGMQTLEEALADTIAPRRFNLLLLGAFAASAALLALTGIYGVISYAVAQRTREIGVRVALGASRGTIAGMVVGQGMAVALAGIAAGMAAAYGLTRLMASLLFEVQPHDPATFGAAAAMLAAAALAACWLPARRAARIDPVRALRYE